MTEGYHAMTLEVKSTETATTYSRDRGVAFIWGPVDLGVSIRSEITDPDGLVVELQEWKHKI
jgi:hypothetical protein